MYIRTNSQLCILFLKSLKYLSKSLLSISFISKLENPSKEDYIFDGWYFDEKFEQDFLKILDEHKGDKIKKYYEKLKPEYS